jgi:hypothetical protein
VGILVAGCRGNFALVGDGTEPPGPPGPVTVTVHAFGTVARTDVMFHEPDGTLAAVVPTDFNGRSTHDLSPGGMVTALWGDAGGYFMESIAGVKPNDQLVIGIAANLGQFVGDVSVTLPGPAMGAGEYAVFNGCGEPFVTANATTMAQLGYSVGCAPQDRGAVLVVAYDVGDNRIAYGSGVDIALDTGQTAQVTTSAWQTVWNDLAVDIRNPPAAAVVLAAGALETRDGVGFEGTEDLNNSGAPTTIMLRRPMGFANGLRTYVEARVGSGVTGLFQASPEPPETTTLVVDLAPALPSLISAIAFADAGGRPSVRFDATGDLGACDGGQYNLGWNRAGTSTIWRLIVPPGMLEFRVPELPDLEGLRPVGTTLMSPAAAFFDADFIDGYDELRTSYKWLELPLEIPATSSIWYTEINEGLEPRFPE